MIKIFRLPILCLLFLRNRYNCVKKQLSSTENLTFPAKNIFNTPKFCVKFLTIQNRNPNSLLNLQRNRLKYEKILCMHIKVRNIFFTFTSEKFKPLKNI